jgi:hypothetical protein
MQNKHAKRPFNRKKLSEQNQYVNKRELDRQLERNKRKKKKRMIFVLKAVLIAFCAHMLFSVLFKVGPRDPIVIFALYGIPILSMVTALIFLSGSVAPMSFWGRIDRLRQKRAQKDERFKVKRLIISELWIVYTVFCTVILGKFVLFGRGGMDKISGFAALVSATYITFFIVILLSDPQSFWGRLQRLILDKKSVRKIRKL